MNSSKVAHIADLISLPYEDIIGPVAEQSLIPIAENDADTVPGDTSTTATLTVGANATISGIDTIGDQDFYAVQLVAGHTYSISMASYLFQGLGSPIGPVGIPLLDSYLELYSAGGTLIASADGGSDTTFNTVNSGFDALLTFTATATGTYYINARAFDNIAQDGPNGDMIGDYAIQVKDVTGAPGNYTPYYAGTSPLYAIDWGTQVDGTVRNPDGVETGHVTGNTQGTPANPWGYSQPGKNVITIYFAKAGDVFVSNDLTNPGLPPATITATGVQQFEHDAVMTALGEFSKVADIVYVEVTDRAQANFIYTSYIGTPGPGVSLLGSMSPPGESDEGLAQFNSGDYRWTALNLQQGGFSYVTLIHEFGHGHGLAHPHDNGGHSGIMNGVESDGVVADYTTGDFDLNQGVFTMMSYEDGWQSSPYGNAPTDVGYGYMGGLMAFDIAAIQDKYGVNEDWATGDDVYTLKDVNAAGTYYSSIWDAGGNDTITYGGSRDANIDLRPATLKYEEGGGGRVSYAYGIFGGFTIANGVVIENATGGSGNDTLTGNDAANVLTGNGGNDLIDGGLGADRMIGGMGDDIYIVDNAGDVVVEMVGQGTDTIRSSISWSLGMGGVENLELTGTASINGIGSAADNRMIGNSGNNSLNGGAGNDWIDGGEGADTLKGGLGDDTYVVDNIGDVVVDFVGEGIDTVRSSITYSLNGSNAENLVLTGTASINGLGSAADNWMTGNIGANTLNGGGGNDHIDGGDGADVIRGGIGNDVLIGGAGQDKFYFSNHGAANWDVIQDFSQADDTIYLDRALFGAIGSGELSADAFRTGSVAVDADDRILYDSATGNIYYDEDGAGGLAAVLVAQVTIGSAVDHTDFFGF